MPGPTESCGFVEKTNKQTDDGGNTTTQLAFCYTLKMKWWRYFKFVVFDNWFIWLQWHLCCLTVAEFKPNMLKPSAVVFWDWKWRECPVSLTDVRMRERAQTDTVNHPSIHWLTPLGTHSVSVSHRVETAMSDYLFSPKAHDDTSGDFAHLFWSAVQEVAFHRNSIHLYCYNICYHWDSRLSNWIQNKSGCSRPQDSPIAVTLGCNCEHINVRMLAWTEP